MKISYNWLKEYIEINESPEELSDMLTGTGLEVEGLAKKEPVEGGLEGLVVGKVLECKSHPNADRLRVTLVDIGSGENKQVVCGAPNVDAGQTVIVAPVGSTIYPKGQEPIKLKKAKIRGEVSEGMICAEDELGLGENHDGIMVLKEDYPAGKPAKEVFNIEPDYVIEIGLTPNRADAASHIGVARDLKALLNRPIKWPSVEDFKKDKDGLKIDVEIKNQEACPRYSGVTISNVKVEDSPDWLKNRLLLLGLTPINNIVDITNYVLHETGQPLHAFDAAKITDEKVVVKTLPGGTKFTTLDEIERKLQADDLMICAGDKGLCIAGVFGGIESGITEKTKNVFLESAYFSPAYIRKTAQYHQLKTDASFRYERGTDPHITVYALKRAALLIKEIAGGEITSNIIDNYPRPIEPFKIEVKYRNINRLIGKTIPVERIHNILTNLDISVQEQFDQSFIAIVPPYRVDVTREADIIEEILRIYGLNNVELPEFASTDFIAKFPEKDPDKVRAQITDMLVGVGFSEIMTNSLTKPIYAEKIETLDASKSVEILNKLSEDLGVLRQSLLFSGLEVVGYNINRQQRHLRMFEFGKVYRKARKGYEEKNILGMWVTGDKSDEYWRSATPQDFYHLSSAVSKVMHKLLKEPLSQEQMNQDPFEYCLKLSAKDKNIALLGKVKGEYCKLLSIKQETFYAELDWDLLLTLTNDNIVVEDIPKFPEVRRDLSLVVDKNISFERLKGIAYSAAGHLLQRIFVFDIYEGDKIDAGKKAYALGFILQDKNKTLKDKQIEKTMDHLMKAFEQEAGAFIRQ